MSLQAQPSVPDWGRCWNVGECHPSGFRSPTAETCEKSATTCVHTFSGASDRSAAPPSGSEQPVGDHASHSTGRSINNRCIASQPERSRSRRAHQIAGVYPSCHTGCAGSAITAVCCVNTRRGSRNLKRRKGCNRVRHSWYRRPSTYRGHQLSRSRCA